MIVLDSSAFINASLFEIDREYHTVSSVIGELKDLKSQSLADSALVSGKLQILEPSKDSVNHVKQKAAEVGSSEKLSITDVLVLALAFEHKAKIVTDDYTMQNLAAHLGLEYEGVIRGKIEKKKTFT